MDLKEGGVRKLDGGASPHAVSALTGVSKLPQRTKADKAPEKRVVQILREFDGKKAGRLAEGLAVLRSELETEGIETLLTDAEKDIRSTDASEPPQILRIILFNDVAGLIARPKTHEQVRVCVELCRKLGIPVVIRGAASSAFGAVLPPDGGFVIDMGAVAGIKSIDSEKEQVTVLAGTRWVDVSLEIKKKGLTLRTCPSSCFSTVGGWFATGGYGLNSLSFGHISKHVSKIRVVLPDGSDSELLPRNELFDLMIGSEGQLGVITEVTLSVRKAPKFSRAILVQTADDQSAFKLISSLLAAKAPVTHMMFFDDHRMKEIERLTELPRLPLQGAPAVLIVAEGGDPEKLQVALPADAGATELPEFMGNLLWGDRHFPMRGRIMGPGMLGSEVVVPLSNVPQFLEKVRQLGHLFGIEIASEAHILSDKEALLLSFFLTDQRRPLMYTIHAVLSMLITRTGTDFKGRPYAIGIWNQPFSSFVISRERMETLKRVNRELDPDDLFNPGKFLSKRAKLSGPLSIFLKERMTLFALGSLLGVASLAGRISRRLFSEKDLKGPSDLELSTYACARCGACVTVCPAYLVAGRESVTGRGKLLTARKLIAGTAVDEDEVKELFLCMKCHACEEVCQTRLPLLSAYEELEEMAEARYGRPKELIGGFVAEVESSAEYKRMLYEGTISPDAGLKEGDTDAV